MREIKFRVWDKQCRLYLTLAGADWGGVKDRGTFCNFKYIHLFPPEGVPICNPSPHYGGCVSFKLTDSVDNDRLVFEQYTGLKDKNGREIYEGDIIVQKSLGSNKSGCRGKITYKEDHAAFMFEVYERGKPVMWLFLSEFNPEKTCEVIGNIHEDPELVEEEK